MRRQICVQDFSGTTGARNLKVGTNVVYDLLSFGTENQPPALILPIIRLFVFLSNQILCHRYLSSYVRKSPNFDYT